MARTGWLPKESGAAEKAPAPFPWATVATFVGLGLLCGYAWLWLVMGEAVGAALVVGPVLVVLSLPIAGAAARRMPRADLGGLVMLGLLLRMGFAYYRAEHATDALVYHDEGVRLADAYRALDFGANTGSDVPGTGAMRALSGFVHVIVFDDFFASFLVFAWLGFVGAYLLLRAFEIALPDGDVPRYAVLLMLWPSMCFWPSSLGKDAWMVFTIGVASYGAARVYQRLGGGYTLLGLGLLAASFVRPHLALVAIVAFAVALLFGRRVAARDVVTPGFVAKVLGLVLVVVVGSVLVNRTQRLLDIDDFSARSIESAASYVEGQTTIGGSAFSPPNPRSPAGFPQAVVTVLFRPFPTEARGFEQVFTAVEGLALAVLTVTSVRRLRTTPGRLRTQPYVTYATVYVLVWTLGFGVIANFGILARQRTQMLPFFFVLLALSATRSDRRRERRPRLAPR